MNTVTNLSAPGISIAVCCYNSASRIEVTLRHLFALRIPNGLPCEIILINNNCTDDTVAKAKFVSRGLNSHAIPFRIIDEPEPGLAFARNCAVRHSAFDNIIFCDDDNHLQADFLEVTQELLSKYPDASIFGGIAKPKFTTEKWLIDFFPAMAVGPQAPNDGWVNWVYGAGMVIRKGVFNELAEKGIQFLLTDRKGDVLVSGGDAEICALTRFLGKRIFYSSRLVLYHAIPAHRLQKRHYLNAKFNTIFPSVFLYILDTVIQRQDSVPSQLWRNKIKETLRYVGYFAPRIFLGKHQFYSFFMFYRSCQMLIWLAFYKSRFKDMYGQVITNLGLPKNG